MATHELFFYKTQNLYFLVLVCVYNVFKNPTPDEDFLSQFKHDPISIEFYVTQCKKCHVKYVASSTYYTLQLLSPSAFWVMDSVHQQPSTSTKSLCALNFSMRFEKFQTKCCDCHYDNHCDWNWKPVSFLISLYNNITVFVNYPINVLM